MTPPESVGSSRISGTPAADKVIIDPPFVFVSVPATTVGRPFGPSTINSPHWTRRTASPAAIALSARNSTHWTCGATNSPAIALLTCNSLHRNLAAASSLA